MEAFGCCAAGFVCGVEVSGQAGGSRDKGRWGGVLGGIAMAVHHWQRLCTALSAAHGAGANVQPAAAPGAAPYQPCHGLSTAGLLHNNLLWGHVLPGSSLRVDSQGCLVQLLPSSAPHWGTGRQLLFADLFCLKSQVAKQAQPERNWSPEPSL